MPTHTKAVNVGAVCQTLVVGGFHTIRKIALCPRCFWVCNQQAPPAPGYIIHTTTSPLLPPCTLR
eukprot:NODE_5070_length_533_cov_213.811983_g3739_i0.p1 GENE.NODE_5070_length_533_cov_213.811983_g3739_i0~~NODE_5070_length_533_cov_213.811983_g3739_i0.p1  ORF type:complete len:65 (-),score=3.07 NODE_5070_length_533_cov_213.811983_g3739_i0:7-201(-)